MAFRRSVIATLLLLQTLTSTADVIEGPTLVMSPNGSTPLAGVVEFMTDSPVVAELTIMGAGDTRVVSFPGSRELHYLPVLGLEPDETYTVELRITPGGIIGNFMVTTPPLPADFPLISMTGTPAAMEPGVHFFDCFDRAQGDPRPNYAFVVNNVGAVVWYTTNCPIVGARQLRNGNLFYRWHGANLRESDMLDNIKVHTLTEFETGLHHDVLQKPDGKYLALDRQTVVVENYPTSTDDPGAPTETTDVADDAIMEFMPDGSLHRKWLTTDMLEPTRIGYFSLRNKNQGKDWGHANALTYVPADDSVIVSVRHQEAVIKFSRETGELIWILGDHFGWPVELQSRLLSPINLPFRWQFAQHAPMLTDTGNLLLFDNGNNRALPFDGNPVVPEDENFSRAVEYAIDEQTMEVEQVWEFGEFLADPIYSRFISDADWQPITGNVVVHFGGVSYVGGTSSADLGLGENHARIIEVTHTTPPQVVSDMTIYDPGGSVTIYRSERIPDVYGQDHVDPPNAVGNSLIVNKEAGQAELSWAAPPVDSSHSAVDFYVIYASESPEADFVIEETSLTETITLTGTAPIQFYKIVAANVEGTSGDEPAP